MIHLLFASSIWKYDSMASRMEGKKDDFSYAAEFTYVIYPVRRSSVANMNLDYARMMANLLAMNFDDGHC